MTELLTKLPNVATICGGAENLIGVAYCTSLPKCPSPLTSKLFASLVSVELTAEGIETRGVWAFGAFSFVCCILSVSDRDRALGCARRALKGAGLDEAATMVAYYDSATGNWQTVWPDRQKPFEALLTDEMLKEFRKTIAEEIALTEEFIRRNKPEAGGGNAQNPSEP